MTDTYYLGANTPVGFRSEYDTLQKDPRIGKLRILKGGSGCGKSTLMRTIAAQAERLGLRCERIPCSSDPDSLDGLVIPEAGLGIVDGTAPHVVEPKLCGVQANYINLGTAYDPAILEPLAPALRAAKAASTACYGPAYAALAASAAVRQLIHSLAEPAASAGLLPRVKSQLLPCTPPRSDAPGPVRRCYLSAFTPAGVRICLPEMKSLWGIRDCFSLGASLIRQLAGIWRAAGEPVLLAMDPMEPDQPAGLILPARDTGYWRIDPVFEPPQSLVLLDLEGPVLASLPQEIRSRVDALNSLRKELTAECVFWLARAKHHHDVLEELCRPAVDFSVVDRECERILRDLLSEVEGK